MSRSSVDSRRLRPVEDVYEVCVESAVENMVSAMALRASALQDSLWNGWARPLATAAAMRDFPDRWQLNDPNGTCGELLASEGHLIYSTADSDDPEVFPQVGTSRSGEPLYDLSGWTWVPLDDNGSAASLASELPQA